MEHMMPLFVRWDETDLRSTCARHQPRYMVEASNCRVP